MSQPTGPVDDVDDLADDEAEAQLTDLLSRLTDDEVEELCVLAEEMLAEGDDSGMAGRAIRAATSRFARLAAKLAAKGAHNARALAAWIGRKKYGREAFQRLAAAGRKAHAAAGRSTGTQLLGARSFAYRALTLEDCHVRSDGDGRVVEAYAAAFGTPAEVFDEDGHYHEVIARSAFDKTIAERGTRIGVFYNHARSLDGTPDGSLSIPIGVPVEPPRTDDHGVYTVTRYLDNPLADWVLDAVKQRALTAQSFSGRFIKSQRTRASVRGALPTITRQEIAWREYGPAAFATYAQAHIVGTRSASAWMSDLLAMDPDERAELLRQMSALATPLEPATAQATATRAAGPADEPRQHSARQSDIALRSRALRIARGM